MKNLFKTTEEYFQDITQSKLDEFEISEFDHTFSNEKYELDISEFEEAVEIKEIKFDFSAYEKSYYYYLEKYLEGYTDNFTEEFIDCELKDFKLLNDLLERLHKQKIQLKDFLIMIINDTKSSSIRYFFIVDHKYHTRLLNYRNTITSIKKIISFLEFKQSEINDNKPKNIDLFELVDLNESTITEKIIILSRLGVLDFLRGQEPFNLSINSLANAISAFTGGNSRTIQSMINPMFSKNVDTKNNPFNTNKTVDKVDQKLIDLGFKLKKTN